MQSPIILEMDNKPVSFSNVWVHLKSECKLDSVQFRVAVPEAQLRKIFDPYDTKPEAESWTEFISNQIESLGTFILEAYFDSMAQKTGNEEKRYEWVVVKVDRIDEKAERVELIGRAEPFEPLA